jgi:hypothetical protein
MYQQVENNNVNKCAMIGARLDDYERVKSFNA